MKKYILIVFIAILFPLTCLAGSIQDMHRAVIARKNVVAAGDNYTNCSMKGGNLITWFGDHTSGTGYACATSATTINGSLQGGTTVVDSDIDPGTSSPSSGDYVYKGAAADDELEWAIAASDFSESEGFISLDVYKNGESVEYHVVFTIWVSSEKLQILVYNDGKIRVLYVGNGTTTYNDTSTGLFPNSTWTNIRCRWNVTGNILDVSVAGGAWDTTHSSTVTAWTTDASAMQIDNAGTDVVYVDNVQIDDADGL